MDLESKYYFNNISLFNIRNSNETRIISLLPKVLAEFPDFTPEQLDVEDIYALTLNNLKPRYVQRGSIVLRKEVTDEMIVEQLRKSIRVVLKHPKH